MEQKQNGRIIGITHGVKRDVKGKSRPTKVAILEDGRTTLISLQTDDDELDFLLGRLEDWQNGVKGGLQPGDTIAMILGGSGDRFAAALSRRGQETGAGVLRIPSFVLKENRNGAPKDDDHKTLALLAQSSPHLFYPVTPRDRSIIRVAGALRARLDAMKARVACEQRLRQRITGKIFLDEEGRYPEGRIDDEFDSQKANDNILRVLTEEEDSRGKELKGAVHAADVWDGLFVHVEGCGERIAAGIIAAIGDIRRFRTASQLKAFCGVHVTRDGKFPRRRVGEVSNWNPEARQSLYLLGDQFNRRPDSTWGRKLRDNKRELREKHPKPVREENGKLKYTDGHIHRMAIWMTLNQFVKWLHREWWKIEKSRGTVGEATAKDAT